MHLQNRKRERKKNNREKKEKEKGNFDHGTVEATVTHLGSTQAQAAGTIYVSAYVYFFPLRVVQRSPRVNLSDSRGERRTECGLRTKVNSRLVREGMRKRERKRKRERESERERETCCCSQQKTGLSLAGECHLCQV